VFHRKQVVSELTTVLELVTFLLEISVGYEFAFGICWNALKPKPAIFALFRDVTDIDPLESKCIF
jgi:hypothetical protein